MTSEEFVALINVDVLSTILGLAVLAWCAGYGAGYVMMLIRRYSHSFF
ncbi:hypothetical protein [Paraglaciecola marina]|nr:hypothetical protein [Paraglaciecola marina]